MKINDSTLNSLKTVTPLLQNLINEFEQQINQLENKLKNDTVTNFSKQKCDGLNEITVFIKEKKEYISSLYRISDVSKNVHYYLVLKKDTLENRNELFDCLEEYENSAKNEGRYFHFHFVSQEIADKLPNAEKIIIK